MGATVAPAVIDPATLPFTDPSAYAAGRRAALEDQAADGPELDDVRRARARRKQHQALEALGDPGCWRPEAVRANAAFWGGYADQLDTPAVEIGDRYGALTVIGEAGAYRSSQGSTYRQVRVRCDCGTVFAAVAELVGRGRYTSCGTCARPAVGP